MVATKYLVFLLTSATYAILHKTRHKLIKNALKNQYKSLFTNCNIQNKEERQSKYKDSLSKDKFFKVDTPIIIYC